MSEQTTKQISERVFLADRVKFLTQEFSVLNENFESINPEKSNINSNQLNTLETMLIDFIQAKIPATPTITSSKPVQLTYHQDLEQVIKRTPNSKMYYNIVTENFFVNRHANSSIPSGKDNRIPQLGITLWWLGNQYGDPENFAEEIKRISESYTKDFEPELNKKFLSDPKVKDSLKNYCLQQGKNLRNFTSELVRIELQEVYYEPSKHRPIYYPQINLTMEKKIGGEKILSIDRFPYGDKKTYTQILKNNDQNSKNISRLFNIVDKASGIFSAHKGY